MSNKRGAKVLLTILGIDQHEVGALAIASEMRDAGMEVVYQGRFNLPPAVIEAAIQEDVDVIGISAHSWEYLHFLEELLDGLKSNGADIPIIVGGSVVTETDKKEILAAGVAAAFGPADNPDNIIQSIQQIVENKDLYSA